jgi:hypothetical protein
VKIKGNSAAASANLARGTQGLTNPLELKRALLQK